MTIRCLLWDWGDTLCDERFIWGAGPEWMTLYESFDDGWAADWNTGAIDMDEFSRRAGEVIGKSAEEVTHHMTERSRHVEFYPFTYQFFRDCHLPQAIVTVNPDLWSNIIAPLYRHGDHAELVTSWEEGTEDKRVLCRLAIERLGIECEPGEALLIDNKLSNIDAWRGAGGAGYHYRGDEQFRQHVAAGIDALAGV